MAEHCHQDVSLVCVGNLTIDEVVYGEQTSAPAVGGDAAYAALAARRHIDTVTMLASVGNDFPVSVLDSLRTAGVRIGNLPKRDLPTIRNIIRYHSDGSRTWEMLCTEAEFDALSVYPNDVPGELLAADGMMLSAMSLQSQLMLTPWLRQHSAAALYLDLQEDYLEGTRDELFGLIADCDVFLPSEIEAITLAGTDDLKRAAHLFQELGPRTVVIKLGARGCVVLDGSNEWSEVPADAIVAVDSTGAGDAFCGAFSAVHMATGDPVCAAQAGAAAARIAIGSFGIAGLLSTFVSRGLL